MLSTNISRKRYFFNSAQRYAWPDPFASQEQYDKLTGRDIENMTDFERWQEIKRLENELAWLEPDAILFFDMSVRPARIIYKQSWAVDRIKKLKEAAAA